LKSASKVNSRVHRAQTPKTATMNARYWFLDIQTTGTSAGRDFITEIAWSGPLSENELLMVGQGVATLPAVSCSYVRLPEDFVWQRNRLRKWKELTGQEPAVLAEAPTASEVWQRILSSLQDAGTEAGFANTSNRSLLTCVIHFAQFEKQFLSQLHGGTVFPFEIVCTHRLARDLLPSLPSKSLRSVAGRLGHFTGEYKRASDHLEATLIVASSLFSIAGTPREKIETVPAVLIAAADRLALPNVPGVYRFIGPQQSTLYIGKATSLKSRVNSYFRGEKSKGSRLHEMLAQARSLGIVKTSHPITAALLESLLIKEFEPPYNRALRTRDRRLKNGLLDSGPVILSESAADLIAILRFVWGHDSDLPERCLGEFHIETESFAAAVPRLRSEFEAAMRVEKPIDWSSCGQPIHLLLRHSRYLVSERRIEKLKAESEAESLIEGEESQLLTPVQDEAESPVDQAIALLKGAMRQLLRSAIRARAIHRVANSTVKFFDSHGTLGLELTVSGGRVDSDAFDLVTEDPVFAPWVERFRAASKGALDSKNQIELAEWDFCSVLLGEVQRYRSSGGRVAIVRGVN
jgi:DNA polymerase III epsilon subunit-like protein